MNNELVKDNRLLRFGFKDERGGVHLARTMMLNELEQLLDYVSAPSASHNDYIHAIEGDNRLGKRSGQTRKLTAKHLANLYALDFKAPLFSALRYFWDREIEGRPLLAFLCAYTRDPILRLTTSFVLTMSKGQLYSRVALEGCIEAAQSGRFSKATLQSTARNIASTWTQAGYLKGRVSKTRTIMNATSATTAYALFIGYLTGARGLALFETEYAKLLDCSFDELVEFAERASQRGWINFKRIGNVMEVLFPNLLNQDEMGFML